jgi:dTDP-4-dehydrorhamnose reductase
MKIIIIGSGGRLGAALMREYRDKFEVTGFNRTQLDLAHLDELREELQPIDFAVLINAAAFTNVDLCERERDRAFRINAEAPRVLAEVCRDKDAKLIHFSTDYVFDGEKRQPYIEEDEAKPISVYGESKRAGEKNVLAVQSRHLVMRVSWVFGPDRPSFIDAMIKRAREEAKIEAIANKFSTPTYACDIAEMLPRFFNVGPVAGFGDRGAGVIDAGYKGDGDYSGILHFANAGECSWQEYAQWALDCCQRFGVPVKAKTVGSLKLKDMTRLRPDHDERAIWIARRPVYSVLSAAKYTALTGISPRAWRDAVADYIRRFYSNK